MRKINATVLCVALLMGTNVYAESNESVNTDSTYEKKIDGTESTVKTERTNDPKGLGNKSWSEDTVRAKMKTNGDASKSATHKSVDSAGTTKNSEVTTERDVKSDGTVETNTKKTIVNDPKGLMNKSKSVAESKVVVHPDGTKTVTETTDGNVVVPASR